MLDHEKTFYNLHVSINIKHTHRYKIHECELDHVFEEKGRLRVHIDEELEFEEHMSTKIKKANSIVGLIRRSFSYLDCKLFKKLYTTFVRPHLEYAQAVWSRHLIKHINMMEKVQRNLLTDSMVWTTQKD